jgi:hypothetical protein
MNYDKVFLDMKDYLVARKDKEGLALLLNSIETQTQIHYESTKRKKDECMARMKNELKYFYKES